MNGTMPVHETFPELSHSVVRPPGTMSDLASDQPGQQRPGFRDRARNCSSGRNGEYCQQTDRPLDRRPHMQDCLLACGEAPGNVPIGDRVLTDGYPNNAVYSFAQQPIEVERSQTIDQTWETKFPYHGTVRNTRPKEAVGQADANGQNDFISNSTTSNPTRIPGFTTASLRSVPPPGFTSPRCNNSHETRESTIPHPRQSTTVMNFHISGDFITCGNVNNAHKIVNVENGSRGQSSSQEHNRFNKPVIRFPRDVPDLTRSGGTFQIQPGSSVVIGSSDPLPRQTPSPSRPPTTSRPANPSSSAPPRGWRMANVISPDHKRHLTNLYLNRELDRLASFGQWPIGRPNVSPVALARAAFFYLGDMDRTQCFSCGGVLRNWSYEDDAMDEHRTHFPNCRFVVGTERRNVPISNRPETPQELADKFPCRFPMNPHMRSDATRVDTFDRRWPINRTRAKPQEIAEAGFFFLGERDRVKCWYCNGGIQNWEYDDIPWVEHAKWFPNCQFMLQRQGQLFIYRYLSLNSHLPGPIIRRQDGSTIDPIVAPPVGQSARVQDIPLAEPRARVPTPPPTIVDPQEVLRKRQERVDREMESSELVKVVLSMGFSANAIRRVLLEKLESGTPFDAQNIFEGTSPLFDAVMKMEEEIEKERQEEQTTSIKFPSVSSNYSALSMGSMETAPSSGQFSGVYQVSGFDQHDSDDEEIDLYGSLAEQPMNGVSVGAVGGAINAPMSAGFIGTVIDGKMSIESETRSYVRYNVPDDPESMKEFIKQRREEQLCKICFTENADMVFIPCSHMVCCKTCNEAIRQCPVCKTKIEKAIKTYVK